MGSEPLTSLGSRKVLRWTVSGFGLFMRFADDNKKMKHRQPYTIKKKKKKGITKAAENVVEVIEIVIAFYQHCFVAMGGVGQFV